MKKGVNFVFVLLLVSLSFVSCNKDDDNDLQTSGSIVGKWEFLKEGAIVSGQEILTAYNHTSGCSKDFLDFKSNGIADDYSYEKPSGSCVEFVDAATWVKVGNTLSVNYGDGDFFDGEIMILNNTTLKIKFTDDDGVINVTEFVRK